MTTMNLSPFQQQFLTARDRSVPLVVARTADPGALVAALSKAVVTPDNKAAPAVQWDAAAGFTGINAPGTTVANQLGGERVLNPFDALTKSLKHAPERTAVFALNLCDFWKDPMVRQAIWNLRDPFKRDGRTLVATVHEGGAPPELEHDVYVLDDPLPSPDDLSKIVLSQYKAARLSDPSADVLQRAVDAVAGLSAFAAEQATVLSLRRGGLDLDLLRERHRQMIQNTKGLSVWRGDGSTFDDVGGLDAAKSFLRRFRAAGMYRFGSVFWIDELEKALAGVKGDLTGITQDYLGVLLAYMQDYDVPGILLMGHPGTGKSYLAKAFGAMSEVPVIRADLGAMHGSLVGQSQHALRHAIKVQHAVSQGRPLFVATCNNVAVLPPELTNRFVWRYFVDMPTDEEKAAIWTIQMRKRGVKKQPLPRAADWNGREIDQCVRTAVQLQCSLVEASDYIVPIAQSSAEEIERRRREAHGRYLSASHPGPFGYEPQKVVVGGRQIKLGDDDPTWTAPGGKELN